MENSNADTADAPPGSYAAVVAGAPRITRSGRVEVTRIQGGNTDAAANAPAATGANPPSPHVPVPTAGAIAEKQMPLAVAVQLAEKDAEMAALKAQVEKPMSKVQVDKPMKKAPRVTMSSEAAGVHVPVGSDAHAKKKKRTNVVVN